MSVTRRWSLETIALEILRRYQAGEDLCYSTISTHDTALLRASMRYFGSWRNAVEAAGLNYEDVKRYKTWTSERIVNRIRELHAQGADLSWRHISTRLDPQLAAAATKRKHFGSWRSAITAAGLDYNHIRRYREWTPERITHRLQELHRQGVSLNARHIETYDITLLTAARRRFESWDHALTAAGLDYREIVLRAPFQRRSRKTSR